MNKYKSYINIKKYKYNINEALVKMITSDVLKDGLTHYDYSSNY